MKLPNFNTDTLGRFLEDVLERLETVENVMVAVPGVAAYIPEAEAGTEVADELVKGVVSVADALGAGAKAPPAPSKAAASPVETKPATAPPTPSEKLKAALAGMTAQ